MAEAIQDLQAQRAALDIQIAQVSIAGLQAAQTTLNSEVMTEKFGEIEATIAAIGANSEVGRSVTSLVSIWNIVRRQIDSEVDRVQATIDAASAVEQPSA